MICPYCETSNNPGSKFCMNCGACISQEQVSEKPKSSEEFQPTEQSMPEQAPVRPQRPGPVIGQTEVSL